jgi:hypothetical protein
MPMTTLCALAIVVSLVPAPAPQAAAAAKAQADADMKELASYTLTMETLNKVDRVMQRVAAEMRKDPKVIETTKLQAELKTLTDKDEPTEAEDKRKDAIRERLQTLESSSEKDSMNLADAQNLNSMAAKIQSIPVAASALRAEGMAPREYSKFMLAMMQAGLAAGMQKAGLLKTTPEGTNPANIKFLIEHEAELQKMQKAWEAK